MTGAIPLRGENSSPLPLLLDAAFAYAKRGWLVFPLKPRSKEPLTKHGFKDGTTNEAQIRLWWTAYPDANVGVRTGKASGLFVVDLDPDETKNGWETLADLEATHGAIGPTPTVDTPRGGRHLYFRFPSHIELTIAAKSLPGIDYRGEGGYVVTPPSVGANGKPYSWREKLSPSDIAPLDVPKWVIEALTHKRSRTSSQTAASPKAAGATGGRAIPHGSHHDELFRLASSMRGRGAGEAEIEAALVEAAKSRLVNGGDDAVEMARSIAHDVANRYEAGGAIPLTDLGNARRFVALHGRDVLYDFAVRDAWLIYDSRRWAADTSGRVLRLAHDVPRSILGEAAEADTEGTRKERAAFAIRSESHRSLRDMLQEARPLLPAPPAFDADPWLFNVENGTLDLRTGNLREHRREDYISRIAPVRFDPRATCPTWDRAVLEIMASKPAMVRYLHRCLGSAMAGTARDQALHIWWGTGGNGKSTILKALLAIFGDYAGPLRTDALFAEGGGANEDIARLAGLRLVVAIETHEGAHLNEALVKALTGGDRISASYKYGHVFDFDPQFTPILATNHLPRIRDDDAIWRRIKLLPFTVRFAPPEEDTLAPASARDVELPSRFRDEPSGILNRLLEGCLEWQRIGLAPPDDARNATKDYRREETPVRAFIEETFKRDPAGKVARADVAAAWESYAVRNDEPPLSSKQLASALRGCGLGEVKTDGGQRYWSGISHKLTLGQEGT